MKRFWPIVMPPLFLFVLIVVLTVEEANGVENFHVKVSVSEETLRQVPSCIPSLAWVELVNTHPSDTIQILSIDAIEIDVPSSHQHRFFDINKDDFPFSLSPGQTEYKPLIFLPRDNDNLSPSSYEEINSHQIIAHTAIIRVNTSEGVVHSPFRALSVLTNPYGLPAGLHFQGELQIKPNTDGMETARMRWEYDVFVHNPSSTMLYIFEIFSSEQDWIDIKILNGIEFDFYGPIEIPPNENRYIGTVVVLSNKVITSLVRKHDNHHDIKDAILIGGYLHIRTNLDELVMPVDLKLKGIDKAVEAEKKIQGKDQRTYVPQHKSENEMSRQSENDTNMRRTVNFLENKGNDMSEAKISDQYDDAILYNREDLYFPTTLSPFALNRNTTTENPRKKIQGFQLLSNTFRRKSHESLVMDDKIERTLSFTNNCSTSLTIQSLNMSSRHCTKWFKLKNEQLLEGINAKPGETWKSPGVEISLIYFGNFSLVEPTPYKACALSLTTNMTTHEIPIILYGNEILITAETDILPSHCVSSLNKHEESPMDMRECSAEWWDTSPIEKDLKSSLSPDIHSFPLPLNFGAIAAGEVSVRSIMLTNLNPIPVKVLSKKSSLEGMEISLGRTSARVVDYVPSSEREFWNHPFFPELGWRNDVKFSSSADENLRESFLKHGIIELFRDGNHPSTNFYSSNKTNFIDDDKGGILLSLDGQYRKQLILSSAQQPKSWSIPPGAEARFDVYVRAPPKDALSKEITSFIASGIVLETATTTLDLMVTFDTLLGKLEVSPKDYNGAFDLSLHDRYNSTKILRNLPGKALQIPSCLRPLKWFSSQLEYSDPSSIELMVTSSFSNDIVLSELQSCNKWFSVTVNTKGSDGKVLIPAMEKSLSIGHLYSTITCQHNNFFACAVDWIENSNSIQPLGCGLENSDNEIDNISVFLNESKEKLVSIFKEASSSVSSLYPDDSAHSTGHKYPLDISVNEKIQRANEVWQQITDLNLNRISTVILAKTNHLDDNNDTVYTSVPVLYAESKFTIPVLNTLVNSTLDFGLNRVSSHSYKYISVTNPTAIPLRVRITSTESPNLFVQYSPDTVESWWTGNNYWMSDGKGNAMRSHHNVSVKSSGGAHVSLVNPSLYARSSFILGCGKRCGLRNEVNGLDQEHVLIGASTTAGIFNSLRSNLPPAFAVGNRGLIEAEIPAFGKAKLGPIYFRPSGKKEFKSEVYLQNSLNGFEQIILKGSGGLEKLSFMHEDVEQRIGRPTLVFSGNVGTNNTFEEKFVTLFNSGDVPVDIRRIFLSTSEITYFSSIKPFPTNGFSVDLNQSPSNCEKRGFKLINCNIDDFEMERIAEGRAPRLKKLYYFFSSLFSNLIVFGSRFRKNQRNSSMNSNLLHDRMGAKSILLKPGQNRTIKVQHHRDCAFGTDYVTLNVEYRNPNISNSEHKISQNRKTELLMGYDVNQNDVSRCRSSAPNFFMNLSNKEQNMKKGLIYIFSWIFIISIVYRFILRQYHSASFRDMLTCNIKLFTDHEKNSSSKPSTTSKRANSMKESFYCLTKSDPTSQELIALGKEQTKKTMLSRYKNLNVTPIHYNFECARERGYRSNNMVNGTKTDRSSNREIRFVTDLVYGSYDQATSIDFVPSGLGWRSVVPVFDRSWDWTMEETRSDGVHKVRDLLRKRTAQNISTCVNDGDPSIRQSVTYGTEESDNGDNRVPSTGSFVKIQNVHTMKKPDDKAPKLSTIDKLASPELERNIEQRHNPNEDSTHVIESVDVFFNGNGMKQRNNASRTNGSRSATKNEKVNNNQNQTPSIKKRIDTRKNNKLSTQSKATSKVDQVARDAARIQSHRLNAWNVAKSQKVSTYIDEYAHKTSKSDQVDRHELSKQRNVNNFKNRDHDVNATNQNSDNQFSASQFLPPNAKAMDIQESPLNLSLRSHMQQQKESDVSNDTFNADFEVTAKKSSLPKSDTFSSPSNSEKNTTFIHLPTSTEMPEASNIDISSNETSPLSMFRPPPGLPPPPGFTSESGLSKEKSYLEKRSLLMRDPVVNDFVNKIDDGSIPSGGSTNHSYNSENLQLNDTLTNNIQSYSPLIAPADLTQTKSQVSAIGSERTNMGSELRMSSNDEGYDPMQANMMQLGLGGGFNIENYLSNIWNDSITSVDEDNGGGNQGNHIDNPMSMGRSGSLPPSNPWDSSLRDPISSVSGNKPEESRASAYGIEVEDRFSLDNLPTNLNSVPTSSFTADHESHDDSEYDDEIVYLKAEVTENSSQDGNGVDNSDEEFFDGDTFVVNLVGE